MISKRHFIVAVLCGSVVAALSPEDCCYLLQLTAPDNDKTGHRCESSDQFIQLELFYRSSGLLDHVYDPSVDNVLNECDDASVLNYSCPL